MMLPMLYRTLIKKMNREDNIIFMNSIYNKYKIYEEYNPYLYQLLSIKVFLLKYYQNIT